MSAAVPRKKHFERGRYATRDFISTSEVSENVCVSSFESFICDLDNNGPSQSGLENVDRSTSTSTILPGYSWIKDKNGQRDLHNQIGKNSVFNLFNFQQRNNPMFNFFSNKKCFKLVSLLLCRTVRLRLNAVKCTQITNWLSISCIKIPWNLSKIKRLKKQAWLKSSGRYFHVLKYIVF